LSCRCWCRESVDVGAVRVFGDGMIGALLAVLKPSSWELPVFELSVLEKLASFVLEPWAPCRRLWSDRCCCSVLKPSALALSVIRIQAVGVGAVCLIGVTQPRSTRRL
jgi:hypothetical protein